MNRLVIAVALIASAAAVPGPNGCEVNETDTSVIRLDGSIRPYTNPMYCLKAYTDSGPNGNVRIGWKNCTENPDSWKFEGFTNYTGGLTGQGLIRQNGEDADGHHLDQCWTVENMGATYRGVITLDRCRMPPVPKQAFKIQNGNIVLARRSRTRPVCVSFEGDRGSMKTRYCFDALMSPANDY